MTRRPSILVADDDALVLRVMARVLGAWGRADIVLASGGAQALEELDARRFDLVISDVKMPDVDGFAVVEAARRQDPETQVLLVTGHASDETRELAAQLDVDVLRKPFTAQAFVHTVERRLSGRAIRAR